MQMNLRNVPVDEDDSKPLKSSSIKSEESNKKARNDDETIDETQDEG